MSYKYCIVGFGIAGQILLLELLRAGISKTQIIICDETFLGGDLITKYGSVLSNTPWWKTKKALEVYTKDIPELSEDKCTPLSQIVQACLQVALKAAEGIEKHTTTVLSLEPGWTIKHTFGSFTSEKVFLTIGATEKTLEVTHPRIPLHIALDKNQLSTFISTSDKITVFGTSHSGVIALDNLNQLSTPTTAVYKGLQPFIFESETYGGLKEASEVHARAILAGKYPNITLIPWSEPLQVYKALTKTTKIICATGFEPKKTFGKQYTEYNTDTAEIKASSNIYGFGIAYPGITTLDGVGYQDVSLLSFQAQIQRCLPAII